MNEKAKRIGGVRNTKVAENILKIDGISWDSKIEGKMIVLHELKERAVAAYDKPTAILEIWEG